MRLVAEHVGLRTVLGCAPSQWACYRFARQLRERDGWALAQAIDGVLAGLRSEHPNMSRDIAIDASDLPAYATGHRGKDERANRNYSDPGASWGHRSAVSTRAAGGFYDRRRRRRSNQPPARICPSDPRSTPNRPSRSDSSTPRRLAGSSSGRRSWTRVTTPAGCTSGACSAASPLSSPSRKRPLSSAEPASRRTVFTGRSPGPIASGALRSGAARPVSASPRRCGSMPTACIH